MVFNYSFIDRRIISSIGCICSTYFKTNYTGLMQ